jgi:hypothetical protein
MALGVKRVPPPRAAKMSTQADIVFCVDATASMQPCISRVKDGLRIFAENLQSSANVDFRLRLIAFRDRHDPTCGQSWIETDFMTSVNEFYQSLESIIAQGGGDNPESTLDALYLALHSKWRSDRTHKTIVLLTDDDTHPTIHPSTYSGRDNDIFRIIQDFQTMNNIMLFMVAPKFPIYELIEKSMISADRKVVFNWVPYHVQDERYKGLSSVNWVPLMEMLGKTISSASVRATR